MKQYTFYTKQRKAVVERHSIYRGLSHLQKDCLKAALKEAHNRPTMKLRRIAKRKAFIQRVKWITHDTLLVLGYVGLFGCVLAIGFILLVLGSY